MHSQMHILLKKIVPLNESYYFSLKLDQQNIQKNKFTV